MLIALASLIWVPIGVWIGLRPRLPSGPADRAVPGGVPGQPVLSGGGRADRALSLNPEIWLSPLMVLGTQWYILFNVIAGAIGVPHELRQAAENLGLRGWLWWRRVILPAIFPAY